LKQTQTKSSSSWNNNNNNNNNPLESNKRLPSVPFWELNSLLFSSLLYSTLLFSSEIPPKQQNLIKTNKFFLLNIFLFFIFIN